MFKNPFLSFTVARLNAQIAVCCFSIWLILGAIYSDAALWMDCSDALASADDKVLITNSPLRTWKSSDGKFSRQGRLIAIEGDKARLEAPDKKIITVPIDRLAPADQAFIADERSRTEKEVDPFMENDGDPFSSTERSDSASPGGIDSQPVIDFIPNQRSGKIVQLNARKEVDLNASHWQPQPSPQTQHFRIPTLSFHARVNGLAANLDNTKMVVLLTDPFGVKIDEFGEQTGELPDDFAADLSAGSLRGTANRPQTGGLSSQRADRSGKVKSWIEVYDLVENESLGRYPLSLAEANLLDIDPTAKYLLVEDNSDFFNPKLSIIEISDGKAEVRTSWFYKAQRGGIKVLKSGRFLADDHLLVAYQNGIEVWKLNPLSLRTTVDGAFTNDEIRLARDRRHAIVANNRGQFEIDLVKGQAVGKVAQQTSQKQPERPEVDTETGRTAEMKFQQMTLWDADRKVLDKFYLPTFGVNAGIQWIDSRTVLLTMMNQEDYVDIERRVVFLRVTKRYRRSSEQTGWTTDRSKVGDVHSVDVIWNEPQLDEEEGDQQSLDLELYRSKLPRDAESMLLLKRGDRIRLTVDLQATPHLNDQVRDKITKSMSERGVIIDDAAKDELKAVSNSSEEVVEFRKIGFGGGGTERATVKTIWQNISLLRDGEVVYRQGTSSGGATSFLELNEGETVQQAVDRRTGNPEKFWNSLSIPEKIAVHPEGRPWSEIQNND